LFCACSRLPTVGWQVTPCDSIWPATCGHTSVALRWIFYEEPLPYHNHFQHFNSRHHHHHRDAKRLATAYPAVVLCRKNNLSSPSWPVAYLSVCRLYPSFAIEGLAYSVTLPDTPIVVPANQIRWTC